MTVAAMRRASRMRRGILAASERASPAARLTASLSLELRRGSKAIRSPNAHLEPADDGGDRLALGACGEGQCHAVFQYGLGEIDDVVDRWCEPSFEQGAGPHRKHQGLAGTRTGTPGDELAD